jgi:8-oxo-dGTP pyrophosphatase MutT (NUDIX family)
MPVQTFQVGIKALIRNDEGQILMVHIPEWSGNPAHWDLPGGRIDTGESFLETLKRELIEEIGVSYVGKPKQIMTFLTKITIPVGSTRMPLIFVVYEVKLPKNSVIKLDPKSAEDDFKWFFPSEAADEMVTKFSPEFCELVRSF